MNPFKTIWNIARRDLILELRRKEVLFTILGFSTLVLSIFVFSIDVNNKETQKIVPAIYWSAIIFSFTIALGRRFSIEVENGALEALILSPISRDIIFLGKFTSNFILLLISSTFALPITSILFNINILNIEYLLLTIIISFGLSTLGTFFAIMSIRVRAREVMLSLVFFPAVTPLLFAGVDCMDKIIQNSNFSDMLSWIFFVLVYDALFFLISLLLFDHILQE